MKYCTKCGCEHDDKAGYCKNCGAPLKSKRNENHASPMDTSIIEMGENKAVSQTGAAVAKGADIKSGDPKSSIYKKVLLVGGLVLVVVLVCILLLNNKEKKESEDSGVHEQSVGESETVINDTESSNEDDLDENNVEDTVDTEFMDSLNGGTIEWVERSLEEMNYDGIVVNQYFSDEERNAIYRFQLNHGLEANGILDQTTFSEIEDALEVWRNKETESIKDYTVGERRLKYNPDNLMTGSDVKYVQSSLIEMNYTDTYIEVNGRYDQNTEAAVKRFQKNHSLEVDGICGPITFAELEDALEKWRNQESDSIGGRRLKYNPDNLMSGSDVEYVQSALIEMKYTDTYIKVNGVYDSYTEEAVKRFQRNHSLEVDGICGPITFAELESALAKWRKK